jgi:hypothetical protein
MTMELSWQLIATCVALTAAMLKYDYAHRARNALLAGALGAAGALFENALRGDPMRAAFFVPFCFLVAGGGTFLGYLWENRRRSRS